MGDKVNCWIGGRYHLLDLDEISDELFIDDYFWEYDPELDEPDEVQKEPVIKIELEEHTDYDAVIKLIKTAIIKTGGYNV